MRPHKGLLWEDDGFLLLYKRLDNGSFQWPRNETEARLLSPQQTRWLLEGLKIDQPKAIGKEADFTIPNFGRVLKHRCVILSVCSNFTIPNFERVLKRHKTITDTSLHFTIPNFERVLKLFPAVTVKLMLFYYT